MSTDYQLFMEVGGPIASRLDILRGVRGVSLQDESELHIEGLFCVRCIPLDDDGRDIMRPEYGEYGLDLDWNITGTLDKDLDSVATVDRLLHCAAAIVNSFPEKNCSLMRNGESFYLFNTSDRLLLSPIYRSILPRLNSLFNKPYTITRFDC